MRFTAFMIFTALAGAGNCQSFSEAERQAVFEFWSKPDRYTSTVPADSARVGLWQVRLTVDGSQWLWNYQRGKKVPPTQNPQAQTPLQKEWETWINARLARDRWEALQVAQSANEKVLGKRLPDPDKDTPGTEPPRPGPIPASLVEHCGNAPLLAEAVVPIEHAIRFDDVVITYRDNTRLSNPRNAYYRSEKGVMSGGVPAKNVPKEKLDQLCSIAGISESEARIMKAVSMLEGGFDAVNTYDTGYVSIGFIQFASLSVGANSLGALLKLYKETFPEDYAADFKRFGIDVTEEGVLHVLDLNTGAELTGPLANTEIIEDKRLVAVFQRAGQKSDKWNAMQLKAARDLYMPVNDVITLQVGQRVLTGKVSDFVKTEAGMAVLMDRKVNTGKLDPLPSLLAELAAEVNAQSLADLAAYERDIILNVIYRKDYLGDVALSQPKAAPGTRWSNEMSRKSGRTGRGG